MKFSSAPESKNTGVVTAFWGQLRVAGKLGRSEELGEEEV